MFVTDARSTVTCELDMTVEPDETDSPSDERLELEAAMLKGLEGPRHPVDETFFTQVRAAWKLPEQN